MSQLPPAYHVAVAVRGPWWTDEEPSLRVPRPSGGPAVSIWTAGEGPDVLLLAPDAGSHDLWSPLSPLLRDSLTIHAPDRSGTAFADDVDHVVVAAESVGARCLVGFAEDLALLREAGWRAAPVRSVLVLTAPGEEWSGELLDERFMRRVEVSSSKATRLTAADARRIVDNVYEGDERS